MDNLRHISPNKLIKSELCKIYDLVASQGYNLNELLNFYIHRRQIDPIINGVLHEFLGNKPDIEYNFKIRLHRAQDPMDYYMVLFDIDTYFLQNFGIGNFLGIVKIRYINSSFEYTIFCP